jgi:ubiquitin C-terminal hydrolase
MHLKRFQFERFTRRKIETSVSFPLSGFDLSPFANKHSPPSHVKYELYGLIHHYGNLNFGHYTAYANPVIVGNARTNPMASGTA